MDITELKKIKKIHNNYIKTLKQGDNDQWHFSRCKGLGGSDVGTILGINKYKTKHQLWLDKRGCTSVPMNNKMYMGHVLEPVIAQEFAKATGYKVKVVKKQFKSKDYPFLLGYIDRLIIEDNGEKAILECKNCSNSQTFGNGYIYREGAFYNGTVFNKESIPLTYYCQVQHYMNITGIHKCYLACLIDGSDFRIYHVPYNQTDVNKIISVCTDFWINNICLGIEPEKSLTDYENDKTERINSYSLDLDNSLKAMTTITDIKLIKQKISELENTADSLKASLFDLVKSDADEISDYEGKVLYTIKTNKRKTFDTTSFKKDFADLYLKYLKESVTKPTLCIK